MIGVELVADKETRQHLSAPHFVDIWEMCKDMGVLFGRGGLNANVSIFARMIICDHFQCPIRTFRHNQYYSSAHLF